MNILSSDHTLPPGVAAQLGQLLGTDDVYFVPIRHHSPACALALQTMLRELQPQAILIEGPDDLGNLLPLLQHPQTKPPIALLCQASRARKGAATEEGDVVEDEIAEPAMQRRSSFFPLCEYSPEWVALRAGAQFNAQVAWIDLPWQDQAWNAIDELENSPTEPRANRAHDLAQSLMAERHFAHSKYLQLMAQRLGCVDHQDLWDRLFELRDPAAITDWRGLFADVFCWCAMARLDYEPEVLEAELSLPRERRMAAHIAEWRAKVQGPMIVVTGGFHTPELLRSWKRAAKDQSNKTSVNMARVKQAPERKAPISENAWLIRYSFERLDALNGYSAGMPSPGYYQLIWDRLRDASRSNESNPYAEVALECLTRFAQKTRAQDHTDAVSTPLVHAAALQARRLADLRGNAGPGRQDILDAMQSCFVKGAIDDGKLGFNTEVRGFLCGSRIGDIPPSAGSPPLIEDARRLARAAGVRLDDSSARISRLDLYRKPSHRVRSRFFHAMAYLETDFAKWRTGPDFLGNSRLHLLFEEWQAAWSPLVEARLIELSTNGVSIESVCLSKIEREELALATQGRGRSASAAVQLLLRACLIGLQQRLPQLLAMLSTHLDEDAVLASVVDCGHRLVTLWRAREPLGVQQHPQLLALLQRAWPAALFLLPNLMHSPPEAQGAAVQTLLSLRELGRLLEGLAEPATKDGITPAPSANFLAAHLQRLALAGSAPSAVRGAASALLYLDGIWDDAALSAVVHNSFGVGAQTEAAVGFLSGLMAAAPELLLQVPSLLQSLNALVGAWSAESFMAYLPELRRAFTGLRPQETSDLATLVLQLHGAEGKLELAALQYETSEMDLHAGLKLQAQLSKCLTRDGLKHWLE